MPAAQDGIAALRAITPELQQSYLILFSLGITRRDRSTNRNGYDLLHDDLHVRVRGPHLLDKFGIGGNDVGGRDRGPLVVSSEMHQDDIWFGRCKPVDELVFIGDVSGQETSVSFVLSVIREPTG
jgi:hypothetical protein